MPCSVDIPGRPKEEERIWERKELEEEDLEEWREEWREEGCNQDVMNQRKKYRFFSTETLKTKKQDMSSLSSKLLI